MSISTVLAALMIFPVKRKPLIYIACQKFLEDHLLSFLPSLRFRMIFACNRDNEVKMTNKLSKIICRLLFILSFLIAGVAVSEKLANFLGLEILRGYSPSRLLAFSVVSLLFVIALQLREIKKGLNAQDSD